MSPEITSIILFCFFGFFLVLGVPISIGIGLSAVGAALFILPPDIIFLTAAQRLFGGADNYAILAIPFFILSGELMNKGGIARRLINLAQLIGGRLPGSLAHTNVIGNMLFGAVSGSSIASAAAIGGSMAPLQKEAGYDKSFSAAVNIASAPCGILIPPSGPLILYSLISGGTSIAALFVAGYLPGILMGLAVMLTAYVYAVKHRYSSDVRRSFNESVHILLQAIPSLALIFIIIGGIAKGIFDATEGASVAALYSLVLSLVYKTVTLKDLPRIFLDAMKTSTVILFLIASSAIMSWVLAYLRIPQAISFFLLNLTENPLVILLLINVILLIVGTVMDLTPAVLIFTPILLPIAESLGMHPVHFGIMLIFNLGIGNMTPPVGSVLFVGCRVGGVSIEEVSKPLLPYFLLLILTLMLVTFIPSISLFLPKLMNFV